MGTQEVLKVLEKAKSPLTSKQIASLVKVNARTVRRILKDLLIDVSVELVLKELKDEHNKRKVIYYLKN